MKYKKKAYRPAKPKFIWYVVIAFCVSMMLVLVYFRFYKYDFSMTKIREKTVHQVAAYLPQKLNQQKLRAELAKEQASNIQETLNPVHFDFYDELPKVQMGLPQTELEGNEHESKEAVLALKTSPASAPNRKKSNEHLEHKIAEELALDLSSIKSADAVPYIVQLGVFHSVEAAYRYRLALLSAGLKVNLIKIRTGKEVVYRLQQGPYYNREQLNIAKKRLRERGIACDIRRATPYISGSEEY